MKILDLKQVKADITRLLSDLRNTSVCGIGIVLIFRKNDRLEAQTSMMAHAEKHEVPLFSELRGAIENAVNLRLAREEILKITKK